MPIKTCNNKLILKLLENEENGKIRFIEASLDKEGCLMWNTDAYHKLAKYLKKLRILNKYKIYDIKKKVLLLITSITLLF